MQKSKLSLRNVAIIVVCLAGFSVGNVLVQDSTTDQGVVINGVKWATRNVDEAGTFAPTPESAGKFYQWNRRTAWNTTDEKVIDWNSSMPEGTDWEKANDPSPEGWRVPTLEEMKTLLDEEKVSSEWTIQNGVSGIKFTDKTTGNFLFLPRAGYRSNNEGTLGSVGLTGSYWGNTQNEGKEDYACSLYFNDCVSCKNWDYKSIGFSIRPIAY